MSQNTWGDADNIILAIIGIRFLKRAIKSVEPLNNKICSGVSHFLWCKTPLVIVCINGEWDLRAAVDGKNSVFITKCVILIFAWILHRSSQARRVTERLTCLRNIPKKIFQMIILGWWISHPRETECFRVSVHDSQRSNVLSLFSLQVTQVICATQACLSIKRQPLKLAERKRGVNSCRIH